MGRLKLSKREVNERTLEEKAKAALEKIKNGEKIKRDECYHLTHKFLQDVKHKNKKKDD